MSATLKTWCINGVVAALLVLMLVQTWPGVPEWLSWRFQIVADATGLHQRSWGLFAPEPDNENHRLRAVMDYRDGTQRHWISPVWREQSTWQRFVGHRHSEYTDALRKPFFDPALPGFARWLVRHEAGDKVVAAKRVEIHADYYDIPDPRLRGWKWEPGDYDQSLLLYAEDFP